MVQKNLNAPTSGNSDLSALLNGNFNVCLSYVSKHTALCFCNVLNTLVLCQFCLYKHDVWCEEAERLSPGSILISLMHLILFLYQQRKGQYFVGFYISVWNLQNKTSQFQTMEKILACN